MRLQRKIISQPNVAVAGQLKRRIANLMLFRLYIPPLVERRDAISLLIHAEDSAQLAAKAELEMRVVASGYAASKLRFNAWQHDCLREIDESFERYLCSEGKDKSGRIQLLPPSKKPVFEIHAFTQGGYPINIAFNAPESSRKRITQHPPGVDQEKLRRLLRSTVLVASDGQCLSHETSWEGIFRWGERSAKASIPASVIPRPPVDPQVLIQAVNTSNQPEQKAADKKSLQPNITHHGKVTYVDFRGHSEPR